MLKVAETVQFRQDPVCWLEERGLQHLLDLLLVQYIDTPTVLRMGRVCRAWRDLLDTPYLWCCLAARLGLPGLQALMSSEVKNNLLCCVQGDPASWGATVRREIRWRRRMRAGRYG